MRDLRVVAPPLLAASAVCIALVVWAMGGMGDMGRFDPGAFAAFLLVWIVMMAAMMLPSAAPAIAMYHQVIRRRPDRAPAPGTGALTTTFTLGYLATWTCFGVLAYLALRGISSAGLGMWSPARIARLVVAPAALLAAIYQLTPMKSACLRHCRGPLRFMLLHRRPGIGGALRLGSSHGAFCVGCCWLLMVVLLALGLSSLVWMTVAALAIALEKLLPVGTRAAQTILAVAFVVLALVAIARPGVVAGAGEPMTPM